jgi:hypothetical protein
MEMNEIDPHQQQYERQRAAEEQRRQADQSAKQAARREATIDAMNFKWDYPALKVFVRDGKVVRPTLNDGKVESRVLGDLKEAKAGMTSKHRRVGFVIAVGLAGLGSGQAKAYIVFPDGSTYVTKLIGNGAIRQAELDVARFNADAESKGEAAQINAPTASSQPAAGVASGSAEGSAQGAGVAAELERLVALHSSGALDDEEFRAAKARIIHGS